MGRGEEMALFPIRDVETLILAELPLIDLVRLRRVNRYFARRISQEADVRWAQQLSGLTRVEFFLIETHQRTSLRVLQFFQGGTWFKPWNWFEWALWRGRLDLAQELLPASLEDPAKRYFALACGGFNANFRQWRDQHCADQKFPRNTLGGGNSDLVEWLSKRLTTIDFHGTSYSAGWTGNVGLLQWLVAKNPNFHWTAAFKGACFKGHLPAVQWLHAHAPKDLFTRKGYQNAVVGCQPQIIAWYRENGWTPLLGQWEFDLLLERQAYDSARLLHELNPSQINMADVTRQLLYH